MLLFPMHSIRFDFIIIISTNMSSSYSIVLCYFFIAEYSIFSTSFNKCWIFFFSLLLFTSLFTFTFQFKWYRRAIFKWKMDMLKMMIVPTQDCNSHVWFSCKLKEKEKIKIFRIIHFENWANSFHWYQYNIQMLRIKLCLLFL